MKTSIVNEAFKEYQGGNYIEALRLYRQAALLLGEKLFKANIHFCEQKIQQLQIFKDYTPNELHKLKVACVMDAFTFHCYEPECNLLPLTPDNALAELNDFNPDILFIESAWRGKDDLWDRKIGTLSQELKAVLQWCKQRYIPTIFWNKEDPIHFETFLTTAQQFDYVFTTDIDCIGRYKAALGHDRIYLLPFACQPKLHNPIEKYVRKDAFCFAGAYYVRYPERTNDLENYIAEFPKFRPLEIFDRNFGKNDVNYQFPPEYQEFIIGTLPFNEIDKAYKGYRYAINLNSIKQSQTMFARRVYELLGSNTLTISNFSRGIRLMFGDLVIASDNAKEVINRLYPLDEENRGKLCLAGLRKVMVEHTYAHRLTYIANKVLKKPIINLLPPALIIALATSKEEFTLILQNFQRQTHTNLRMLLVLNEESITESLLDNCMDSRIRLLIRRDLGNTPISSFLQKGEWLVPMLAQDYYGPNYLLDLLVATGYSQAKLIGKLAYYQVKLGSLILKHSDMRYQFVPSLPARSSIHYAADLEEIPLLHLLIQIPTLFWCQKPALAIDSYSYCRDGAFAADQKSMELKVNDLKLNVGISINELMDKSENIQAIKSYESFGERYCAQQIADIFGTIKHKEIVFTIRENVWLVSSELPDGKHDYIYASRDIPIQEFYSQNELKNYIDISPGLNITLVITFLCNKKQKINFVIQIPNRNHTILIPENAYYIRLGFRISGRGIASINTIDWYHRNLDPSIVLGRAKYLVLTNQYPAYDNLYRNGFVNSRVKAYREQGVEVDVFCLRNEVNINYYEFNNIDIITGRKSALENLLMNGKYQSVLVHFLDPNMWEILVKFIDRLKIIVWIHGADIQPWYRRKFNYANDSELNEAKAKSDARTTFWREIFEKSGSNLKFVFVSRYFAEQVMEDTGIRLSEASYEIIHNPIDVNLFVYQPKPVEQRFKILSIRPYVSAVYANDLNVKAILDLSKKSFFKKLEFLLIGDGELFDSTLLPLRDFSNVIIQRGFLTQEKISQIHKSYGVFLCASRSDTHGVSRDEAMASGLVPITHNVAAIPEFVSDNCGFLVLEEDYKGLAEAIEKLVFDESLFSRMSEAASKRVRNQSNKEQICAKEIAIFDNP